MLIWFVRLIRVKNHFRFTGLPIKHTNLSESGECKVYAVASNIVYGRVSSSSIAMPIERVICVLSYVYHSEEIFPSLLRPNSHDVPFRLIQARYILMLGKTTKIDGNLEQFPRNPWCEPYFLCWFNSNAPTIARSYAADLLYVYKYRHFGRLSTLFEFYWTCQQSGIFACIEIQRRWLALFPPAHVYRLLFVRNKCERVPTQKKKKAAEMLPKHVLYRCSDVMEMISNKTIEQ